MSASNAAPVSSIAQVLESVGIDYAIIGAHAVNVWVEPRFTADVDVTIIADTERLSRLRAALGAAGYTQRAELGGEPSSGPDFMAWTSPSGDALELQVAKTALQKMLVARAVRADSGARVATKEDLIVLKLIADRPKDRIDLHALCAIADVDWAYVERWAADWGVADRLRGYRA